MQEAGGISRNTVSRALTLGGTCGFGHKYLYVSENTLFRNRFQRNASANL